MNKIFSWNGIEIPFDMEDSEDIGRFEKAQELISDYQDEIEGAEKLSDKIRIGCEMYKNAFGTLFGSSVSERLVDKSTSLSQWEDAFIAFMQYTMDCNSEVIERREKLNAIASNSKRERRRAVQG